MTIPIKHINCLLCLAILFCCYTHPLRAQTEYERRSDFSFKADSAYYLVTKYRKYREAIQLAEEIIDSNDFADVPAVAMAHNVRGIAYSRLGFKNESLEELNLALDLYQGLDSLHMVETVYNNLGVMYIRLNELDSADYYFNKVLETAKAANENYWDSEGLVFSAYNIAAQNLRNQENIPQAIDYLEGIVKEFCESDRQPKTTSNYEGFKDKLKGSSYVFLGKAHFLQGDIEKSLDYFKKSEPIIEKYQITSDYKRFYRFKSAVHAAQGNYELAYSTLYPYITLSDSLAAEKERELRDKLEVEFLLQEKERNITEINEERDQERYQSRLIRYFFIGLGIISLFLLRIVWLLGRKNKELADAKAKTEKLAKAKSQFYSSMSHELRTPLYAVIELSSLLLKEKVDAKHKEYLTSLKFSGNYLLNLVNNILKNNELEYGTIRLEKQAFEIKGLVKDVVNSVEMATSANNNTMSLNYDNTIPNHLMGDATKFSQVLVNLISNANKFTEDGTVTVNLEKKAETADKVSIYVEVVDTGKGIAKSEEHLVFKEFYQGEDSSDKTYKGTGLGLPITKKILEAMGADIQFRSQVGEGTTFFFEVDFEKAKETAQVGNTLQESIQFLQSYHFLVVDDNKINLLVTGKVLEKQGLKYTAVLSGKEAITTVAEQQIDCILMDLNMPEMDGYEATKRILATNPNITVVALTAGSVEEFEDRVQEVGMEGYILKPFKLEDFMSTLVHCIQTTNA